MNARAVEPLLDRCRRAAAGKSLGLPDLVALQQSATIDGPTLQGLREPDPAHPYGRKVLLGGDGVEVMVATWTPGVPCAPHDHGGALGAVQVLQGRARHRIWKVEDGQLRLVKEHLAHPGELLACGPDMVHSMGDDGAEEPLMTLHLYTPTIDFMVVYDQDADQTLVVAGDCGAWIPEARRVRRAAPGMLPRGVVAAD
jgi:cysteine dioxygenase